jgi:superfamily II DNA or RNA helicase
MELYPYQKEVIKKLYSKIKDNEKRICLYAPTGAGKTVIISKVIQDALTKNRKILFLVHRGELVNQTLKTLKNFDINAGVIKAGYLPDPNLPVQIASIQTLNVRGLPKLIDIVFIDECHTTSYYKSCKEILKYHDGLAIGITATPWRTKKKEGLSEYYNSILKAPLPFKLIDLGFLVPPVYFGYDNEIDLSEVRTIAGEYALDELDVVCNTKKVIKRIVKEYIRLAHNRTTICFAITVSHAKQISNLFNEAGIKAGYIEAKTSPLERSDKYIQLSKGELKVLASVGVLTEGFDVRSVSAIILARPTKSMALNYQMVGRGLRIHKESNKKDCIVIDFSNNTERHGMVQTLDSVELDTPLDTESKQMTKTCPNCNNLMTLNVMECSNCGYKFEKGEGIKEKRERTDDLIKLLPPDEKKKRQLFHKYAQYAYHNGKKPTWALYKYHGKYRKWPKKIYRLGAIFGEKPDEDDQKAYLAYLLGVTTQFEIENPIDYIKEYMDYEFAHRLTLSPD